MLAQITWILNVLGVHSEMCVVLSIDFLTALILTVILCGKLKLSSVDKKIKLSYSK